MEPCIIFISDIPLTRLLEKKQYIPIIEELSGKMKDPIR